MPTGAADNRSGAWLAFAIISILCGVLALSFVVSRKMSHHSAHRSSREAADEQFNELRLRFSSDPFVEVRDGKTPVIHTELNPAEPEPVRFVHALTFDPATSKLIRTDTRIAPARLFRLMPWAGYRYLGSFLSIRDADTEFERESTGGLTLDLIRQHGPGLLIDHRHSSGGRIVVWVD